jgi:diguanylate cyclase (GGDEF)-like protein
MTMKKWPLLLAGMFLMFQAILPGMSGKHAIAASFYFLVLAPLFATFAAVWRCRSTGFQPSRGWSLAALSMFLWTLGMAASARQDLFLGNPSPAPADSVFIFILYGVPLTWAIASAWHVGESLGSRLIDAILAVALGVLYFVHSFTLASLDGNASDAHMEMLVWMFDAENVFLFIGLLTKWYGANERTERTFFGILSVYAGLYLVAAGCNNHLSSLREDSNLGTPFDILMSVPFVVFAILCLLVPDTGAPLPPPPPRRVHFIRSASPLAMALALLVVSLFVVRFKYGEGVAGILIAVLGYGLRTTLSQLRHIETEEGLRREQRSLEMLALSDGLTGVGNRRAFDNAFAKEWRRAMRSRQALSLLMIDIDEFKVLNDRYGHPVGDRCLRLVASELQRVVKRPADLLARYGGEEFAVLLADTELGGAIQLAEQLREVVQALQIENTGSRLQVVSVSIGVASIRPEHDAPAATLIQAADEALYEAKRQGRNRTVANRPTNS